MPLSRATPVTYKITQHTVFSEGELAGTVTGALKISDAAGNALQTIGFTLKPDVVMPIVNQKGDSKKTLYENISSALYAMLVAANYIPAE